MQNELILYKGRGKLYSKFLERMYDAWQNLPGNSKKDYLSYKEFTTKIPRSFQINKFEAREILLMLEDLGFVSIKKRGIELNYKVIENEKD